MEKKHFCLSPCPGTRVTHHRTQRHTSRGCFSRWVMKKICARATHLGPVYLANPFVQSGFIIKVAIQFCQQNYSKLYCTNLKCMPKFYAVCTLCRQKSNVNMLMQKLHVKCWRNRPLVLISSIFCKDLNAALCEKAVSIGSFSAQLWMLNLCWI